MYNYNHYRSVFKQFSGFSRSSKYVYFSTLWIDRNTMTSFERCSGSLTLFFLFYSSLTLPTRSVNRKLFYLRLTCAVFERTATVNGEGRKGHCRSWCLQQELASLLLENQKVFISGKHAEISNLETISSMDRWWAGIAKHNFVQRVPNEILWNCFQQLEVIFLCLSVK